MPWSSRVCVRCMILALLLFAGPLPPGASLVGQEPVSVQSGPPEDEVLRRIEAVTRADAVVVARALHGPEGTDSGSRPSGARLARWWVERTVAGVVVEGVIRVALRHDRRPAAPGSRAALCLRLPDGEGEGVAGDAWFELTDPELGILPIGSPVTRVPEPGALADVLLACLADERVASYLHLELPERADAMIEVQLAEGLELALPENAALAGPERDDRARSRHPVTVRRPRPEIVGSEPERSRTVVRVELNALARAGERARLELAIPAEGVRAVLRLRRHGDRWVVVEADVVER